jgi:hypothetical protein
MRQYLLRQNNIDHQNWTLDIQKCAAQIHPQLGALWICDKWQALLPYP